VYPERPSIFASHVPTEAGNAENWSKFNQILIYESAV